MSPLKSVSFFFLKVLLAYVAFVALWEATPVREWYPAGFQACGSTVFRAFTFGDYGKVWMQPRDNPTAIWDSELRFENLKTGSRGTLPFGSHAWGYATTIMVLSLILATPVPWRRRLPAVLTGLVMVHAWIGFEIWLAVINTFSQPSELAVYRLNAPIRTSLAFITEMVTKSTVTRYSVATVIWALAAFRSGDWQLLMRAKTGPAGAA